MARQKELPYQLVLWLSARDVDLLETGPRPVSPRVVRQGEIARAVVELLEEQSDDPKEYFQSFLERSPLSPALVVFDNFETVESPPDVFAWIDAHIRPPNKVLITTRYRDFLGDFPLTVGGMTDTEATELIGRHAERLGIADVLTADYRDSLIRETHGHPYVLKISLGTVAREGRPREARENSRRHGRTACRTIRAYLRFSLAGRPATLPSIVELAGHGTRGGRRSSRPDLPGRTARRIRHVRRAQALLHDSGVARSDRRRILRWRGPAGGVVRSAKARR